MKKTLPIILVSLGVFPLAGCTSTLSFGGNNGVGLKGTLARDGKIMTLEPTDGNGNASGDNAQVSTTTSPAEAQ